MLFVGDVVVVCGAAQNILCVDGGDGGRMHTKVGNPFVLSRMRM